MPSTTLTASAVGTYNAVWTLGAGADKVAAVAPPDDEATSWLNIAGATAGKQSYVMDDLPAGAGQSTTHTLRVRAGQTGTHQIRAFIRSGGVDTPGTYVTPGSSFANHNYVNVLAAVLSAGVINAAEAGFEADAGSTSMQVTTFDWAVTWEFGGDDDADVIWFLSLVGYAIGGGLLLREMPGLARELRLRTQGRHRLERWEWLQLWRAMREYRHVRYCFI